MYISKFQVLNYKSFRDSGWLEFQPGINIIVGTNNSGKTALLESLGLEFKDNPYRNIRMRYIPESDLALKSTSHLIFKLEKSEISTLIDGKLCIDNQKDFTIFQEWFDQAKEIKATIASYDNKSSCRIFISDSPKGVNFYRLLSNLSGGSYTQNKVFVIEIGDNEKIKFSQRVRKFESNRKNFDQVILDELKSKIYKFNSERFHIGSCPFGDSLILKSDASNLAEVIYQIQLPGKRKIYEKFKKYINDLFPEIKQVSARLINKSSSVNKDYLEVLVWSPEAHEKDDLDLALKLADCGTGVSQVLAMLYVVVTASEPKIIIIDEPQSFLHPNLIRKLINIFKEFPEHQYFIATHSPIVISEANSATILQLSYSDGETKTQIINSKETTELCSLLKDLGVSLSDVFGADAILWVEGETEELCFPRILEKFGDSSMKSIQIMAVKNTGDLEGRHADIIFHIYDRFNCLSTLFPPAIGFILDDENRTEKYKQNIILRGKEKVKFLPRCNYENFLLHPQAILEVLQQENSSLEITLVDIENYIDEDKKNSTLKDWESEVDGAKLIKEIFSKLSENTVLYRKTKHSLEITNWLLKNEPNYLQEVAELLKRIIENSSNE